jgi:hypothetical protein
MTTNERLCVRCAGLGRTCCQGREIYVTRGDVGRIGKQTGLTGFFELAPSANPAYLDQDHDSVWRDHVFSRDGRRRILRWQSSGDCVFLGKSG